MFSYSDQIQRGSFPTALPNGDFLGGDGDPGTGRPQGGRAKKGGSSTKNIVPVEIAQLNNYREDNGPLMIHGIEVSLLLYESQVSGMIVAILSGVPRQAGVPAPWRGPEQHAGESELHSG